MDVVLLVVFFFQAEDGIRDATVTGVQTCALPILDRDEAVVPACVLGSADLLGHRPVAGEGLSFSTLNEMDLPLDQVYPGGRDIRRRLFQKGEEELWIGARPRRRLVQSRRLPLRPLVALAKELPESLRALRGIECFASVSGRERQGRDAPAENDEQRDKSMTHGITPNG